MNTAENPRMKSTAFITMTCFTTVCSVECASCRNESPLRYIRYDGTSGRTHGEMNDRSPARNAVIKDVSERFANIVRQSRRGDRSPLLPLSLSRLKEILGTAHSATARRHDAPEPRNPGHLPIRTSGLH